MAGDTDSRRGPFNPSPGSRHRAALERCVFHARSAENAGAQELVPLSALRRNDPDVHATAIAKYDDDPARQRLLDTHIPLLNASWSEVVFLSAVQPHAIWTAWRSFAGVELPPLEFWAIPVDAIGEAVVLDRHTTATGDPIDPDEVRWLDRERYRSLTSTTHGNAQWIGELARSNRRGAWFHGTPHVLTRGPVPLDGATVINWQHPTG